MSFTHGQGGAEYGLTEVADSKQADKEREVATHRLIAEAGALTVGRIDLLTRSWRAARRRLSRRP